ncbi:hypothetical protein [Enterococcus gallinarum]|uniref:hypothetical protein n=1 Tax=Enterococcus gallinarum TaxID=1353 RepID=UPI0022DF15FD|nr:hypothetical protein [Enterococcus gallinarum]
MGFNLFIDHNYFSAFRINYHAKIRNKKKQQLFKNDPSRFLSKIFYNILISTSNRLKSRFNFYFCDIQPISGDQLNHINAFYQLFYSTQSRILIYENCQFIEEVSVNVVTKKYIQLKSIKSYLSVNTHLQSKGGVIIEGT